VKSFSMAEVKQHGSAASCWSVVDGKVYDLTKWIGRHPGGRARITAMCGKDGTATYRGEHGKESGPMSDLKRYVIGPLA
jgi:cytochrome b involved in lipid metabolism